MVTDETGTSDTVIAACADFPSLVATMFVEPAATPVTSPFASTVATDADDVVHVIARPESTVPAASFADAKSCVVFPITTVAVAGVTDTDATGVGPPPPLFGADGASSSPLHAATTKVKQAADAAEIRRVMDRVSYTGALVDAKCRER
jgi:hypothetical protein